ncbi:GlsB/YeaQ/YmgE family stress response membrane protein [Croceibacterium sp. TMG7-5b_MA50]|uniref:GlsB/YeaQ/YmgE family stress response membrane protein n=1 Tax=Croceibacterium sp. TMG7-5b_MA50 TaxID=3121290 RepID=UPI003221BF8F
MGFIFLLVVGGVLGLVSACAAGCDHGRGVMRNVALGILGALLTGLVINPMAGGASLLGTHYDAGALLVSLAGSLALVAAVNLLRPDLIR